MPRCSYLRELSLISLLLLALLGIAQQPNIIFIIADDMNDYPQLFGGHPQVQTPAMTTLGQRGVVFANTHCTVPICGPSRTSMLTGKDAFYTSVYNNSGHYKKQFRDNFNEERNNETVFTIPEYLKDSAGYFTYGIYKVFHGSVENGHDQDYDQGTIDACSKGLSWNKYVPFDKDEDLNYLDDNNGPHEGIPGFKYGRIEDTYESMLNDYRAADSAIRFVRDYAADPATFCDRPFFLALGFYRPHRPFLAPAHYFPSYYDLDMFANPGRYPFNDPAGLWPANGIVMPPQPEPVWSDYDNLFSVARRMVEGKHNSHEDFIRYAEDFHPLPWPESADARFRLGEWKRAETVMAYIASMEYVDAQIGRIMDELNKHPNLRDNTIIVICGDHGLGFGEKRHWHKLALWENITRVPLLIVDPRRSGGWTNRQTVNLIDVFPTICDLVGIAPPHFPDGEVYLDGISLHPFLESESTQWERPALTSLVSPNDYIQGSCFRHYSVRSRAFHYIRYRTNNNGSVDPEICDSSQSIFEEELYEIGLHKQIDPHEWRNLAYEEDYKWVKSYLQQWIPGQSNYRKKIISVKIIPLDTICALDEQDSVRYRFVIFDESGLAISKLPTNFSAKWVLNVDELIYFGDTLLLLSNEILPKMGGKERLMINLIVEDPIQSYHAHDMISLLSSKSKLPKISFDLELVNATTVQVTDLVIEGHAAGFSWDFGDGYHSKMERPAHTYLETGAYVISNRAFFNQDTSRCWVQESRQILMDSSFTDNWKVDLFPNPSQGQLIIRYYNNSTSPLNWSIYNIQGRLLKEATVNQYLGLNELELDVSEVSNGLHLLKMSQGDWMTVRKFLMQR